MVREIVPRPAPSLSAIRWSLLICFSEIALESPGSVQSSGTRTKRPTPSIHQRESTSLRTPYSVYRLFGHGGPTELPTDMATSRRTGKIPCPQATAFVTPTTSKPGNAGHRIEPTVSAETISPAYWMAMVTLGWLKVPSASMTTGMLLPDGASFGTCTLI